MFKSARKKTPEEMAGTAGARANLYGLMVGIFHRLPDEDFLNRIKSGDFEAMFGGFSGAQFMASYRTGIGKVALEEALTDLCVDRTRILRGTGPRELRPPYEACYKEDCAMGAAAIAVRRFYRSAGMLPDDSAPESPDYLFVEMDFMNRLCLEERDRWRSGRDGREIMAREEAFLRNHLGSWIGAFREQVEVHARTDFYRGLVIVADAFVSMDRDYLHQSV